jgi:Ger(x)C family germination protein
MKRRWLLFSVLIYLIILPGCWDLEEIDHRAFVTALGIDKGPKGSVILTIQLPLPKQMLPPGSNGGGKDGKSFHTVSAASGTVFKAFGVLQSKTSRHLVIQQNRLVIIGEATARLGVKPLLDWMMRDPQLPPQALIFIARHQPAQKILEVTPAILNMPGLEFKMANSLMIKQDHTYFIPAWRFRKIMVNKVEDLYAPMIDFDSHDGQYVKERLAVFNQYDLVGELSRAESQTFGYLTNQMHAGSITYPFDYASARFRCENT